MRIDALPNQVTSTAALPPKAETAGEREPDGDWDDMTVSSTRAQPAALQQGAAQLSRLQKPLQQAAQVAPAAPAAAQALPQGMGTKVDLFA